MNGRSPALALGCIALLAYLGLLIGAGFLGLRELLGSSYWAVPLVLLSIILRFPVPLAIGTFFTARDLWDWHWAAAALLAAPSLLMILPDMIGRLRRWRSERRLDARDARDGGS